MTQPATNTEKRRFSRIAFDSPVVLNFNNKSWESTLIDISLRGVLIARPDDWDETINGIFEMKIFLNGNDSRIDIGVKQAHCINDRIGFSCEQIDLQSAATLRRLIELNLADEALLDREIAVMLG